MQKNSIRIEYCPKCNWLLRAAYMAQEFLTTFENELHEVALQPSEVGGQYRIFVDDSLIFDRKDFGGFAEIKILKQLIRDKISPEKELGHSDIKQ